MKNKKILIGIFVLIGSIFLAGCGHCHFSKKSCCDNKEKKCDHGSSDAKKEIVKENAEQK